MYVCWLLLPLIVLSPPAADLSLQKIYHVLPAGPFIEWCASKFLLFAQNSYDMFPTETALPKNKVPHEIEWRKYLPPGGLTVAGAGRDWAWGVWACAGGFP